MKNKKLKVGRHSKAVVEESIIKKDSSGNKMPNALRMTKRKCGSGLLTRQAGLPRKIFDFSRNDKFRLLKRVRHSEGANATEESVKEKASSLSLRMTTAFTLAEVLITLSILGVVAAISIPSIIQQYQKRLTITKLQKAYSDLEKATNNIRLSTGCQDVACVINLFDSTKSTTVNMLNLAGFKYNAIDTTYNSLHMDSLSGFEEADFFDSRIYYRTANGLIYFFYINNSIQTNTPWDLTKGISVYVLTKNPVRGKRLIIGKNVFVFLIYNNLQLEPSSLCFGSKKCPISIGQNADNWCNKNNDSRYQGISCVAKIIQDGWKITYW